MGIDLGDIVVRRDRSVADYANQRLAVDAWNILYQFMASIRQADGTPLLDASGRITSHLQGLLARTTAWLEAGIKPVFVFDGPPHPLKARTLALRAARKEAAGRDYADALVAADAATTAEEREAHMETARSKAQQTSRLTPPMVAEAQRLLEAMGVPWIQAPGEGEAQASAMAIAGEVDAVVTQDFDALLFGAPRVVRNLGMGGRRKLPGKQAWVDVAPEEVDLAASLSALRLTREQLVDAAILVGTDFNPGVKGVGAKRAAALVSKHGSLEAVLEASSAGIEDSAVGRAIRDQQGGLEDRDEVRRIFLASASASVQPEQIQARSVDAATLRAFLVAERGFAAERVEASLERLAAARSRTSQRTLF